MLYERRVRIYVLDTSACIEDERRHFLDHVRRRASALAVHRAFLAFEAQSATGITHTSGRLLVVVHDKELQRVLVRGHEAPLEAHRAQPSGGDPLECLCNKALLFFALIGGHDLVGALSHLGCSCRPETRERDLSRPHPRPCPYVLDDADTAGVRRSSVAVTAEGRVKPDGPGGWSKQFEVLGELIIDKLRDDVTPTK